MADDHLAMNFAFSFKTSAQKLGGRIEALRVPASGEPRAAPADIDAPATCLAKPPI
jgi:hypothetical protein